MAISVVGLHYAFAPAAADVVFEGERHALVVRYATRVEQAYGAEPRIERLSRKTDERRNGGASRVGSERTAKSVYAVAIHQVVNAVVSVIGHVKGGVLAQGLLDFQAPFLKLSNLGRRVGAEQTRRREVRNIRLDLSQRLVVLEAVDQSHVAGGCLRKQVAAVKSFAGGNCAPGAVEAKLAENTAGNASLKTPSPPLTTLGCEPKGDHAKPNRGCHRIALKPCSSWCKPCSTSVLYGVLTLLSANRNGALRRLKQLVWQTGLDSCSTRSAKVRVRFDFIFQSSSP